MDPYNFKSKIAYYCREQFYNLMLEACKEGLNKLKDDLTIRLYHALSLALCSRLQDAIDELEMFKSADEIKLAAVIALMYTHKFMHTTDKEVFFKLDTQMREFRKTAGPTQLNNAAVVLVSYKKYFKALDYVEKSVSLSPKLAETLVLKGWILLHLSRLGENTGSITEIFENLKESTPTLDINLGLSECYASESRFNEALNVVNNMIVHNTNTYLPIIQKMKLQFAMQDWEQAIETVNRVMIADPNNLEAMQTNILILCCRDANYDDAANAIRMFSLQLEKDEPKNITLLLENAQLFSRICNKNINILTETYKMVEKALHISANNADIINELGSQCLLQGKVKEALKFYKSATKINDSSINTLMGLTFCELKQNGISEQIKNQIEFLLELEESASPKLLFMQSKLCENAGAANKLLNEAIDKHLSTMKNCVFGAAYLRHLDPDFLLDVTKEYLKYIPRTASFISEYGFDSKISSNLTVIFNTLKILTRASPGLHEAVYLLAKIQYSNKEAHEAIANLEKIIASSDSVAGDASLLLAQIQVQDNKLDRANQTLEIGLSYDFNIRDNYLYHFINGLIEKKRQNFFEAVESFKNALALIDKANRQSKSALEVTLTDKASIFKEFINSLILANKVEEASEMLQEAVDQFLGTSEEVDFAILNADICLLRQDVAGAIHVLSAIKPSDPCYLEAKLKLSNVFLKDQMNKKAYIKCYQEVVEVNPTPENYILLADAYLEILEPEKALDNFRQALELNPNDRTLMSKLGQALITTHYYSEAIDYYKDYIRATDDPNLKLELADFYLTLEEFDKAEMLLLSEINSENMKSSDDTISLQYKTKVLRMLALVQEKSGNCSLALSTLKDARDNQSRLRKRLKLDKTVIPPMEMQNSVAIFTKLAELTIKLKDNEQAINHYKDALAVDPNSIETMEELARLYMQMNYLELCQQTCRTLLNLDEENDTASVLMADIAFRKVDFDSAIFHFTQLMEKHPINWVTFVRFIEIMRRTGSLQEVQSFLDKAEQMCTPKDLGLYYCKALYQWYSGNLNAALMNFNSSRQSSEWGESAIYNMIEICLNPNDEMLGDQFIDTDDNEYKDARSMALKTADKLLKELRQLNPNIHTEFKYKLVTNFIKLASKEKINIEQGLEEFIRLASQDNYKDHIGPILGIATAYTLLKQSQRAKNQLKRVVKNMWTFEDAEYLERCWLLLADYYIQSAKYDLASDLLRRVIQYNKTCTKAYELSGSIAEKEQRYKEAANFFENAWKFSGKMNPAVGYKVAYNYMKGKKFADAIDVCQYVLKISPGYPRIKKDILDKCMNNLRT